MDAAALPRTHSRPAPAVMRQPSIEGDEDTFAMDLDEAAPSPSNTTVQAGP